MSTSLTFIGLDIAIVEATVAVADALPLVRHWNLGNSAQLCHRKVVSMDLNQEGKWDGLHNRAPVDGRVRNWDMLRVRAKQEVCAYILSDQPVGCMVHYFERRSQPCRLPHVCPACESHNHANWHSYMGVLTVRGSERKIFDVTGEAVSAIDKAVGRYGSLRGLRIEAKRRGNEINSPLFAKLLAGETDPESLPPDADIIAMLCRMWRLPDYRIAERVVNTETLEFRPRKGGAL